MEFFNDIQKKAEEFVSENASTLLTAAGVVGTVGTGVLAFRAGLKYQQIIRNEEDDQLGSLPMEEQGEVERESVQLTKTEKFVATWMEFVPPVVAGTATIGCIIFSHRMSSAKIAGLAAAYGLTQKQFDEYKDKVEEKLKGPKKDRPNSDELNAELAQDRANRVGPEASRAIVITGGDDQLCFDQPSGRYFKSTKQKIDRAVNRTNEIVFNRDYASLNDFYEALELPRTTFGDEIGFNKNNIVELTFDAILDPDDEERVCLAIDFRKLPTEDFIQRMYE